MCANKHAVNQLDGSESLFSSTNAVMSSREFVDFMSKLFYMYNFVHTVIHLDGASI